MNITLPPAILAESNPFVRGFKHYTITRVLLIVYATEFGEGDQLAYRPLHEMQQSLTDTELAERTCCFDDETAYINPTISDKLHGMLVGVVSDVLYSITAVDEGGSMFHIGYVHSMDEAKTLVKRLSFETGHYSRCWEISTAHITQASYETLQNITGNAEATGQMVECFAIPGSYAIGVKLLNTPWTDAKLADLGSDRATLYLHQIHAGFGNDLVDVFHQAALADVRILIFDPDAPTLDGLSLFDWP